MIEKIVTIPVKAGLTGAKTGAKAGKGLWNYTKNYIAPAIEDIDEIDYSSKIGKRWKNHDIKRHLKKNPESAATLEECVEKAVDEHRVARKWAGIVDTVDKATAPIGLAGDYLIFIAGKYTLGLVEEAVEMAALKGPFMAYYAKNHGAKRIPGWLGMEFLSHGLPFADLYLDCRNNYVKGVDKDIESYAANLFREAQGLQKPNSWLSRLWSKLKKSPATTPASTPDIPPVPEVIADPVNRIRDYMESLGQDKYESFMKHRSEDLPQELERFVRWGFESRTDKKPKWYHSRAEFQKNSEKINGVVCKHLGLENLDENTSVYSVHELEIAGERKLVVEFDCLGQESYRKAKGIPDDRFCIQPMLGVIKKYKLVVDADTGRIEDSDLYKHELWGGLLDPVKPLPYDKKLETAVPEKVAGSYVSEDYKEKSAAKAA